MNVGGAVCLVVALGVLAGTSWLRDAGAQDRWETYANARFAFQGCYPANIFPSRSGSENQDGQTFTSTDGAVLKMFGRNNALGQSLQEAFRDEVKSTSGEYGAGRYNRLGPNWFVVSGRGATRVLYEKTIGDGEQFKTLRLEYGVADRPAYGALVARISECFKSLSR